jgi:hypothetical protein
MILWKQYSDRKFFGFFPMLSVQFLPGSTGSWQESAGKNPDNFRPKYCFHVPAIRGVFLQYPVPGIIDLSMATAAGPSAFRFELSRQV